MPSLLRLLGQIAFYGAVALLTYWFSVNPVYRQTPAGMAQIKLSFKHGGARVEDCRRLTTEELSKLPSTERRPTTCARERLAIAVRLAVDGKLLYDETLEPTGIARDGAARAYVKFLVPAGPHLVEAWLRDSKRAEGYDYTLRREVTLEEWQNLAIDFIAEQGGFFFR